MRKFLSCTSRLVANYSAALLEREERSGELQQSQRFYIQAFHVLLFNVLYLGIYHPAYAFHPVKAADWHIPLRVCFGLFRCFKSMRRRFHGATVA